MHDPQTKRRRRRQRRRPHKKIKRALAAVGIPSAIFGGALALWAVVRGNAPLLAIGAFYLALGGLCLLIRAALGWIGRRASQQAEQDRSIGGRDEGFALVLVLVLVFLTSGLTLHAIASASMALRAARRAEHETQARIAAADRVWNAVRDLTAATAPTGAVVTAFTGGGVPVHTTIGPPAPVESPAAAGGAPAARARLPQALTYAIHAVAGTNGVRSEIYCRARRDNGGTVSIERWVLP